jgi:CDP-glycerol glycerophosphotransferase (TagB/SpsB family)
MTHDIWDMGRLRPSRRKYRIHLWHGHSGPKADGYVTKRFTKENLEDLDRNAPYITKFLATSRINLYFWAFAKALHPRQLLPMGFPRNDVLLKKDPREKILRNLLPDLPKNCKIILYAPTYRLYTETKFFPFDDFNRDNLESWMDQENVVILLRYHMGEEKPMHESERIRELGFDLCNEINNVLREIDLLVTDYSSISSDYMLLDRPIVYVAYDKELFEKHEGFCFGNYDFWTPGSKVHSYQEFKKEIEDALSGQDRYSERRRTINLLINEYQTDHSTEQVANFLLKFLANEETGRYDVNGI